MDHSAVHGWGVVTQYVYVQILDDVNDNLQRQTFMYTVLYVALIFFFSFFWTAITFNPKDMANNMKDYGTFIPGIRPGARTAEYLEKIMTRITIPAPCSFRSSRSCPTWWRPAWA